MKDSLFENYANHEKPFAFDANVTKVFDNMISRSVPIYSEILQMITSIVSYYIKPNSLIYDLGCSTGNTFINFNSSLDLRSVKLIGIDNSNDMLEIAKTKCKNLDATFINHDLRKPISLKSSNIIILNLVLQFLPINIRENLLKECFNSLESGGVIIIVEKTIPYSMELSELFKHSYYAYKTKQGYSQKEIKGKEKALKNVLVPIKQSQYNKILKKNGYSTIENFFQWFNFCGIMAIKE